ncbi:hypothetical protein QCA50_003907 [Cerrena zonata]|uniref:Uncharacterized protein n=1 Tax=Cerrena zonata TaxID=2478898 RepID=A0AAW0GK28_9APHY
MITPEISVRHTAEEAPRALTRLETELSPELLATRATPSPVRRYADKYCPWQAYNRWSSLPSSFIAQHKPLVSTKHKTYDDSWEPYLRFILPERTFPNRLLHSPSTLGTIRSFYINLNSLTEGISSMTRFTLENLKHP